MERCSTEVPNYVIRNFTCNTQTVIKILFTNIYTTTLSDVFLCICAKLVDFCLLSKQCMKCWSLLLESC